MTERTTNYKWMVLAISLPSSMEAHLVAQGLPQAVATPVASLFAAFLGYNPMGELVPAAALAAE